MDGFRIPDTVQEILDSEELPDAVQDMDETADGLRSQLLDAREFRKKVDTVRGSLASNQRELRDWYRKFQEKEGEWEDVKESTGYLKDYSRGTVDSEVVDLLVEMVSMQREMLKRLAGEDKELRAIASQSVEKLDLQQLRHDESFVVEKVDDAIQNHRDALVDALEKSNSQSERYMDRLADHVERVVKQVEESQSRGYRGVVASNGSSGNRGVGDGGGGDDNGSSGNHGVSRDDVHLYKQRHGLNEGAAWIYAYAQEHGLDLSDPEDLKKAAENANPEKEYKIGSAQTYKQSLKSKDLL